MNEFYELSASPRIFNVICPKHRHRMTELRNGLLGEMIWWCAACEKPYYLKPAPLKKFDRAFVEEQLKEKRND